ncbi:MAG TPA: hypothetical protein VH815_10380 [Acidobacteriota bacterium]|jgi:hypothetical protein
MAIKSIKDLPKAKRPSDIQVDRAKKARAIATKTKLIGRRYGRVEGNLGTHKKSEVAGVIKGFRQKTKTDFGVILKDKDGNVIARTHIAKGNTTIPEQLATKALVKYAKNLSEVQIVVTAFNRSAKEKEKAKKGRKSSSKKSTKKSTKKVTKKVTKKSTKKISRPIKKLSRKTTPKKAMKKATKKSKKK